MLLVTGSGLIVSTTQAKLSLFIYYPTNTEVEINGSMLGDLMCALSSPIEVPTETNGESINIAIPIAPSSNSEYMLSAMG